MNKQEISTDTIIKRIDDIVASEIDGETVMMSIDQGKYYGLDLIGSQIWEFIKEPIKVSELIDALVEQFDVDWATCQKDVLHFLNKLKDEKILAGKG